MPWFAALLGVYHGVPAFVPGMPMPPPTYFGMPAGGVQPASALTQPPAAALLAPFPAAQQAGRAVPASCPTPSEAAHGLPMFATPAPAPLAAPPQVADATMAQQRGPSAHAMSVAPPRVEPYQGHVVLPLHDTAPAQAACELSAGAYQTQHAAVKQDPAEQPRSVPNTCASNQSPRIATLSTPLFFASIARTLRVPTVATAMK